MKKRIVSTLLALCMALALLPGTAAKAASLPDWYFLFAIFKNVDADVTSGEGKTTHVKYTMAQDEIKVIKDNAKEFEEYMNSVGVMKAHVDVVEISTTVKDLYEYSGGSYLNAEKAASLLKGKVNLDKYDHVTCVVDLNTGTRYLGITGSPFENGTGQSCINVQNRENCLKNFTYPKATWTSAGYVHEFLHFMERMDKKWGAEFGLHDVRLNFYTPDNDEGKVCYADIMLNQAKGNAGTGVLPVVWQYPPHALRTMKTLTIPSGVTGIGERAFQKCTSLTSVTIPNGVTEINRYAFRECSALTKVTLPGSVTSIGVAAFELCTALKEITIPSGVTSIGEWAFQACDSLEKITIPASVTSIGAVAFQRTNIKDVYYTGTEAQWKKIDIGAYNAHLTNATIHYSTPASYTVTFDNNDSSGDVTTKIYEKNKTLGTLPAPKRDGYKFDGWYTAKTGGTKIASTRKVTKDVTFYARWTRLSRTYLVTFDPNNGDIYQTMKAVFPGMTYGELPTPTRPGYHFKGWFTTQSGKTQVKETTTVKLTGNQTLYAQWQTAAPKKTTTSRTYHVTIPAYYELALYTTATTAKISGYAPETGTAQTITCSQKAALSNGVVRYYGKAGGKNVWFTYSCEMDVK